MIFVKFVKYNKVRTDTGSLVCDFTVLVLELDVWCAHFEFIKGRDGASCWHETLLMLYLL